MNMCPCPVCQGTGIERAYLNCTDRLASAYKVCDFCKGEKTITDEVIEKRTD